MSKIRVGIDVGKDGGIAVFVNDKLESLEVTPNIGTQIDLKRIVDILQSNNDGVHSDFHVVVENVHAIGGSAAGATFSFGWSLGILEGILVALSIPYTKVTPKDWQKELWQGINPIIKTPKGESKRKVVDTKATSLLAAQRLFPSVDFRKSERASKAHDGMVDAILLAEYCRRKF